MEAAATSREGAVVLPAADLPDGARATVQAFGTTIALFNVDGRLYAVNNACPHHGGPLCAGNLGGAPLPCEPGAYVWGLENQVLQCPWHGWEFDMESGAALFDARVAVTVYDARIEDGDIVLYDR
jgi:nitrite reductase (NADH) small subunit